MRLAFLLSVWDTLVCYRSHCIGASSFLPHATVRVRNIGMSILANTSVVVLIRSPVHRPPFLQERPNLRLSHVDLIPSKRCALPRLARRSRKKHLPKIPYKSFRVYGLYPSVQSSQSMIWPTTPKRTKIWIARIRYERSPNMRLYSGLIVVAHRIFWM